MELVHGQHKSDQELNEQPIPLDGERVEAKLQESALRLKTIWDSIQTAIVIIDAQTHTIVDVNPEAVDLIGLPLEEIIGKICHKFICPAELGCCPITDLKQVIDRSERKLIQAEGKTIPIFKTVSPMLLEGKILLVESIIDITERKSAEEQIKKLNEELEQRVLKRTKQLEQANRALTESLEQLKSAQHQLVESEKLAALGNLVAGVAHEVNNPIGVSVTAASHLSQKTEEFFNLFKGGNLKRSDLEKYMEVAAESSNTVLSNLMRASDLMKSFKQVSVDQSSEERRLFNCKEYMNQILLSLSPKLKHTSHSIEVTCPDFIEMETYPGLFSQVITNFVINSLIHGFEGIDGGIIRIEVSVEDDIFTFKYSDNGVGMDENVRKKVFYPFFTTKRRQGGSGLGMYIVYNIVTEKLQGRIECVSQPGNGTQFIINIPMSRLRRTEHLDSL